MGKFPIYTAVFSSLVIVTAFVCLNTQNETARHNDNTRTPEIVIDHKNDKSESDASGTKEEENAPVNAALHRKTKYILKYEKGEVVLITVSEDGKENSSPIASIDISYLTEIDKKALKEGIELENKEAVFKLIEDFSS